MAENSAIPKTDAPETKTADPLCIPRVYAKYIDETSLTLVDCKKNPNKEFIAYLHNNIVARFRMRYPALGDDFYIKLESSAQVQLLMLVRILCVSTLENGLSDKYYDYVDGICGNFHLASVEHDAWSWFAGIFGPGQTCASFQTINVPKELLDIAEKMVIAEAVSGSLPGSSARAGNYSDRIVECVLFVVADAISQRVFDLYSAAVDLDAKPNARISNTDINGILRLFNHGRIPAQSQFFIELGQFGSKFETIKREIKSKMGKPKVTRKKKT